LDLEEAAEAMETLAIYYDPKLAEYMERMCRRMTYGDSLVAWMRGWRLEYRCPDSGHVHYLLCRSGEPVGLQYVRAGNWLPEVQRKLGVYLSIIGYTPQNTTLNPVGVGKRAPLALEHNRLPHLFPFKGEERYAQFGKTSTNAFLRPATL
jgi:hypothetical protein